MTWEEYATNHELKPYVLELEAQKGRLVYYGALHSVNQSNPQFTDIEERWKTFKPTIALSEGGIWPLEKSRDVAIERYGEQGLLRFLAARDKVKVVCLEPLKAREVCHLIKWFSPEKIKVFYVLRMAMIRRMLKKDINDLSYVEWIISDLSKIKFLKGPPNNLAEFESKVSELFPNLEDWRLIPYGHLYLKNTKNWMRLIHRQVNKYRDQNMITELIQRLKQGERVFAIVGRSHVAIQEPVLRSVMKSEK
jgi:hypothetical protein